MAAHRIQGVLFDLDGTFADTAPDLAFALNQTLNNRGRPALDIDEIRPQISHGGKALLRLGFDLGPEAPEFEPLRKEFLELYLANIHRYTRPFPGIRDLLQALEARDIDWGIVTNKPSWLTDPLLQKMGMSERAACIISGDTTPHPKPHPEPLLEACRVLGICADDCVYVGDAQRDIEAGRNAGTQTLIAMFGYLGADDRPESWGADGAVDTPLAILDWIDAWG